MTFINYIWYEKDTSVSRYYWYITNFEFMKFLFMDCAAMVPIVACEMKVNISFVCCENYCMSLEES